MGVIAFFIVVGLFVGVIFEVWWPLVAIVVIFSVIFVKKLQKTDEGWDTDVTPASGFTVDNEDADFFIDDEPQKHPGRCTGDCANCPPHYGYRHGRWYYGRHHVHGCEFGGHGGNGELD